MSTFHGVERSGSNVPFVFVQNFEMYALDTDHYSLVSLMSIHILSPIPNILRFVELLITAAFSMAIYVMSCCVYFLSLSILTLVSGKSPGALIQDGSAISGSIRTFFLLTLSG